MKKYDNLDVWFDGHCWRIAVEIDGYRIYLTHSTAEKKSAVEKFARRFVNKNYLEILETLEYAKLHEQTGTLRFRSE